MLYTNINKANYTLLRALLDAYDGHRPGYTEVSRTGDKTTYLLPSSFEITLDVEHNFPMLETRRVPFKTTVVETLWYLTGETNIKMLKDNNVSIWDHWATPEGDLGPVYGAQLRAFGGDTNIDQITAAVETARKYPNSRQNVVSMWHPGYLPDPSKTAQENVANGKMALPPCHMLHRIRVHDLPNQNDKYLSLHMVMRSSDWAIAGGYNTASYAYLLYMYASVLNLKPKYLTMTLMDPHIYDIGNHIQATRQQVLDYELNYQRYLNTKCRLELTPRQSMFDFTVDDFKLHGYDPNVDIKYQGIAI